MVFSNNSLEIKDEKRYFSDDNIATSSSLKIWEDENPDTNNIYMIELELYSSTKLSPARVKAEVYFNNDGSYWNANTAYSHILGSLAISTSTSGGLSVTIANNDSSNICYLNGYISVKRILGK